MILGIIGNITKENLCEVVSTLIEHLQNNGFDFILCDTLSKQIKCEERKFMPLKKLAEKSDMLISIGGDGTLLNTAYTALQYDKPVLGVNLGKLGFLAEIDINEMDSFINDLRNNNFTIEDRMILTAERKDKTDESLFAVNDFVIGKGAWPKMIELTIKVDDEYVTSYSADGLIIATPTGSTGYSLSAGGPIVSPKTEVITLSPISAHTLTMRPLVLPGNQKIEVIVQSQHSSVNLNCDGQRVIKYKPPIELQISKYIKSLKLVHTSSASYFEILRKKLYWGLDARLNNFNDRKKN
jgi:NAD+ kinase